MSNRVRIPRLPNQHTDQKARRRIARACDECRLRKSKCNGHRPICGQCASAGLDLCVYSDPKRTREQKALELANEQVAHYESILREIYQEVDKCVAKKIRKALSLSSAKQGSRNSSSSASSESSHTFLEAMDVLDEDINGSEISRATGYLGASSEVAWMRSLNREIRDSTSEILGSNSNRMSHPDRNTPIASINYRDELCDYSGQEDENIYALPARAPAERLLRLFLDSVQPSLPIIRQVLFLEQFHSLYSGESIHPGRKWLAVLNLIFAISSRLCQNSGQDIQNRDHQFYFRAEKLNISESLVEDHEDLQQVQVETLAALYLLTSSQINRAWKMIGTATRSSIALGLHLRAMHNKLDTADLEARHKLWWSIFILENLLSIMTGRRSSLANNFGSVPPPLASEVIEYFSVGAPELELEQQSKNVSMTWTIHQQGKLLNAQRASMRLMNPTNELYFFCLADLVMVSHTASNQVYAADAVEQRWGKRKSCIKHYNKIMDEWRSGLPESMGFEEGSLGPIFAIGDAYRVSLAMHYYSSKIVLNRPYFNLPRKAGRSHLKKQTSNARIEIETTCLNSALAILSIFPDQPDPVWVCHVPWWNALHFLVQSTTILLTNISLDSTFEKQEDQRVSDFSNSGQALESFEEMNCKDSRNAAQKALRWLNCLGKTDDSARRAFDLCNTIFQRIAPGCFDLREFSPAEAPSIAPYLAVPTDQTHQQRRSKLNVPYSQFAGARDYGFDYRGNNSGDHVDSEGTGDFGVSEQPSVPLSGVEMDTPGDIFDAEYATLDETLRSLADPNCKRYTNL